MLRLAADFSKSFDTYGERLLALLPHDPIDVVETLDRTRAAENFKAMACNVSKFGWNWRGYGNTDASLWGDIDTAIEAIKDITDIRVWTTDFGLHKIMHYGYDFKTCVRAA
jgi:hypothetical protein